LNAKDSLIQWYNENPDVKYIAERYHNAFIPNSTVHTKENLMGIELMIQWLLDGLKTSGNIK
ncbi:MAG: hypothetical protein ACFFBC_15685, partial [Promethearchaeota archaeon]